MIMKELFDIKKLKPLVNDDEIEPLEVDLKPLDVELEPAEEIKLKPLKVHLEPFDDDVK